jgi:GNAT superfamily N-acetyltransferase
MELLIAKNRVEIEFCKDAVLAFRTNLNAENYADLILKMMAEEQFKIAYIPNAEHTAAAAFVGFRTQMMLRTGRIIYIDDLFTMEDYRGLGYAGTLLDYVSGQALESGIQSIHLDSGYALHPAHRLYLNKGYVLACNHFAKKIN